MISTIIALINIYSMNESLVETFSPEKQEKCSKMKLTILSASTAGAGSAFETKCARRTVTSCRTTTTARMTNYTEFCH